MSPIILLFLLTVVTVHGEVYSSYDNVRNVNNIENHLVSLLGDYITAERARLETLETFMNYVQENKNYTDPETYISYPSNQFNVIHRFTADWSNLGNWIGNTDAEIGRALRSYSPHFPGEADVKGAIKAVHRLMDMYKIPARHITEGLPLEGSPQRGQPLNVKALFLFLRESYNNGFWAKCAGWGQQAFDRLLTREEYSPDSEVWFDVADHYSYCLFKIGYIDQAAEVTVIMLKHYPDHARLLGNLEYFGDLKKNELQSLKSVGVEKEKRSVLERPLLNLNEISDKENANITFIPKEYPGADATAFSEDYIEEVIQDRHYKGWGERMKKYRSLCKETPEHSPEIAAQLAILTCYYKQDTPRAFLAPIKVEEVWPSPKVLIFHDIISDYEADTLMRLAKPLLNRATVHNKETGKLENAEYRVSKTAWLDLNIKEDKENIVRKVNRRMEDATELSHEYAELQQVNNYGMAGQYEPHYDMATKDEAAFENHAGGNRVATLLLYMGKTDAGGATVFVDAGARIAPSTNAAVFWYNLLPNGDPDLITRHAGCPVLVGTKWVMNKWFHVNDQMFTRQCDVEQWTREKQAKLYNGQYTT